MRVFLKRISKLLAILLVVLIANFSIQYFFPNEYERFFEPVPNKIEPPAPLEPNEFNVEVTLMRLGIPTGVVDGVWDERTKQGVCAWRELTGHDANRKLPTLAEQSEIVETTKIEPAAHNVVGVNVNKTCQVAIWIKDNSRQNFEVFAVSTGSASLYDTNNGDWRISWRLNGWHESSLFPDGWMYRPFYFSYSGAALHGSEIDSMVHWYPASHGCVRMFHADIDKLWKAGFGVGDSVRVYGKWQG